MSFSSRF